MQAGEIVDRMYVLNVYMFGFYVLQMIETNSKRCACEGKKTHVKCYCYYILIGWNRFRYNILWCAFQMGITCVLLFLCRWYNSDHLHNRNFHGQLNSGDGINISSNRKRSWVSRYRWHYRLTQITFEALLVAPHCKKAICNLWYNYPETIHLQTL